MCGFSLILHASIHVSLPPPPPPSATGRPREGGGADQPGREPAVLPAGRPVEPLPGGRRPQPPHPVLPGPGAPHPEGERGAERHHVTLRRRPSSPVFPEPQARRPSPCWRAAISADSRLKFSLFV